MIDANFTHHFEYYEPITTAFEGKGVFNAFWDDLLINERGSTIYLRYNGSHHGQVPIGQTRFWFQIEDNPRHMEIPNKEGGILIHPDFQGASLGRTLVEIMEEIGRRLDAQLALVHGVTNPGFLEAIGYTPFDMKSYYKFLS